MIQVGAGPTGLTLALTLLQNGVSVRIIEMSERPHVGQRGAALQVRYCALILALTSVKIHQLLRILYAATNIGTLQSSRSMSRHCE